MRHRLPLRLQAAAPRGIPQHTVAPLERRRWLGSGACDRCAIRWRHGALHASRGCDVHDHQAV